MQSIKTIFIFSSLLLTPILALSKSKVDLSSAQLILSISISGKYSTQISKVYKSQNELICQTELAPYYLILKKNEEEELMKLSNAFINETKKNTIQSDCQNKIVLKLKNNELAILCNDNKIAANLVKTLSQDCGR